MAAMKAPLVAVALALAVIGFLGCAEAGRHGPAGPGQGARLSSESSRTSGGIELAAGRTLLQTSDARLQQDALLAIKDILDPSGTALSSWVNGTSDNAHCGSFTGVTCNLDGLVIRLLLHSKQLTGTIPDFSALTSLQQLLLSNNQLTGTIPDLSALTSLQYLYLYGNQLTGTIPDVSALTSLQYLYLYGNQLTGTIPDLSALTSLLSVNLSSNKLSGSLPGMSAFPPGILEVHLNDNDLTGTIPDLSGPGLPSLKKLLLHRNELTGAVPDMSGLTSLQYLYMFNNQLTGTVPSFAANTALREVNIGFNVGAGFCYDPAAPAHDSQTVNQYLSANVCPTDAPTPAPTSAPTDAPTPAPAAPSTDAPTLAPTPGPTPSLMDIAALLELKEAAGGASGPLSSWDPVTSPCSGWWLGLRCEDGRVVSIALKGINLGGAALPESFGDMDGLKVIRIIYCNLSGPLPVSLSNLVNLKALRLNRNYLSGPLPDLSSFPGLRTVRLGGNDFSGTIPSSYGGLTSVRYMSLSWNRLEGEIPSTFAQLSNLRTLEVNGQSHAGGTGLSGGVPPELLDLPSLKKLRVKYSGLDLAAEFAATASVRYVDARDGDENPFRGASA